MDKTLFEKISKESNYSYKKMDFICHKNVFQPTEFPSSFVFSDWAHEYVKNESKVLEIGCGTGTLSISLAKYKGCEVLASDISLDAVENTLCNILLNGMEKKVKAIKSDVYSQIDAEEKFDFIFWNSAFMYSKGDNEDINHKVFYDPNYSSHQEYLAGGVKRLSENGRLFLGFGSIGLTGKLFDISENLGLQWKILQEKTIKEENESYKFWLIEFFY